MTDTLSKHFRRSEFACQCKCGFDTADAMLVEALEAIREHFKEAVVITSACRCPEHNAKVGGAQKSSKSAGSQHLYGRAADIVVHLTSPATVADYAEKLGLSTGRYSTFTHIDTRSNGPKRWG